MHHPRAHHRAWSIVVLGVMLTTMVPASPAWAHGAGETTQGYVLVQQALGHLAHDSSHVGVEAAMEKVNDTLATKDQKGVDVAEVKQAKAALEADRVEPARTLLQHSITSAASQLMPATGEETGTTVVLRPLPGRGELTGQDWGLGAVSLLLVLAGIALAVWFRPRDTLRQMRVRLASSATTHSHEIPRGARR